ncbi:MAG: xanthine dehydrogenase family protein molybdopterin-binding subunit [Acidimicrobiales bacterium]|nr:xanthine dehydrogenase family protein molybdopterin-binding subunit [Acidimicrobiales bacterium]
MRSRPPRQPRCTRTHARTPPEPPLRSPPVSLLGNRVLRTEDPAFLTVGGRYVGDIAPDGVATVVFVRSTMAHARVESIDTADAAAMPGVIAVVTAADLGNPVMPPPFPGIGEGFTRHLLATDTVRFVGEPVAAVIAETAAQATDAAEQVWVDYDPLPVVVDPEAALESSVLVHEGPGTNVCGAFPSMPGEADFSGCEVVVEERFVNQRVAAAPIEPRVAVSVWGADGRLEHWASSQGPHVVQRILCQVYELPPESVRVITPDVGGGFGAKGFPQAEELVLPALARAAGRPVRWAETRTENLLAMGHGRGQVQRVRIGGTRDGQITALRNEVVQEAGAYPSLGSVLTGGTMMMLTGTYLIPNAEFTSTSVVTNTAPTVAYRGAGRPEAAAAIERAVDVFAGEIGMDPAEVRRRNLLPRFMEPHTTPTYTVYDCGDYPAALERVLEAAGYDDLRAEQRRRRDAGDPKLLGIGLACYVEVTAMGGGEGGITEYGSVELRPDGTIRAVTGSTPYGQGHRTTWAMIIADKLGVALEDIEVVHGDTDAVPSGGLTGGSRSVQIAGSAMADASDKLVEAARSVAAGLLEAADADVVLDTESGRFHVVGTPAVGIDWKAIAGAAPTEQPLYGLSDFGQARPSFPFGAHCAVVEVDSETGAATLVRHVAVDDCGTIINPLLAEGQVHGGLAQGAAQALLEEVRYDDDGNLITANFTDYSVISAAELPSFERVELVTPSPLNPLGAKGIGESGTIGATPAVQNAVIDAVSHLGVRHIDMPCTAEKIWRALGMPG